MGDTTKGLATRMRAVLLHLYPAGPQCKACVEAHEVAQAATPEACAALDRAQDEVERLRARAAALETVLRNALLESGCDGDLCMHEWHEHARKVL